MAKILYINSFEAEGYSKRTWQKTATATSRQRPVRHVQYMKALIKKEKSKFTSPIGTHTFRVQFNCVRSLFREADCPSLDARILEFHQFEMQPVSILIVMPNDSANGLQEIDSESLKEQLPNVLNDVMEKRMAVNLPSKLFKELKRADKSHYSREEQAPQRFFITGRELKVNEPFILVVYDQTNDRPIAMCRVYDPTKMSRKMIKVIKHYRKMDKKLLRQASKRARRGSPIRSTLSRLLSNCCISGHSEQ